MDNDELAQFLQDVQTRMGEAMDRISKVHAELDLTMILLEKVAERTENFREYFFSRKMIDDKRREINSVPRTINFADVESAFAALDKTVVLLQDLVRIAEKEVERLDR